MSAPRTMLTVEDAAAWLEVSRTTMYALIKTGQVQSERIGRLRRVPLAALEVFITQQPTTREPIPAAPAPATGSTPASATTS